MLKLSVLLPVGTWFSFPRDFLHEKFTQLSSFSAICTVAHRANQITRTISVILFILITYIYIHGRVTITDKPITVGPKIDKISKIKATFGLEKERLVGKAKSSRRRG